MSYFMAYVVAEDGPPEDGPDVASLSGWWDFGSYVLDRHDDYPELAHLAQEGWNEGDGVLDQMEHECERLIHAGPPPDLAGVTAQILAGLRARPAETSGVLVTDGEPGGEEEETAES